MKKLLLMVVCAFTFNVNAQEKTFFVKASDTVQLVVIPDEVYNEKYSPEQNERAYYLGSEIISSKIFFELDEFYSQKFRVVEELRNEGKKNQLVTTKTPIGGKNIAWVIILITLLYYILVSYSLKKKIEETPCCAALAALGTLGLLAALAALTILVVPFTASALVALIAALFVTVFTALAGLEYKEKYVYPTWITFTIVGMSIVWYYFTPLFLVCSVAGILVGYLLGSFKKETVLSDGPVK